ncbi:MAG: hypothetical protein KGI92_02845 [Alphaproteobacteria bacterium]|nr:hypothetical protein [Alphaproteobacteria bacterium]
MLDQIRTITLIAAIVFNFGAVAAAIPASRATRLAFLAVVGLWTGFAFAMAQSGALLGTIAGTPIPPIGIVVAVPLVAAALAAALSPAFRRAVLALPTDLLIGLNAYRVLGVFMLLLGVQGRVPGPFPYSAGLGDIMTGVLAVPVVIALSRGSSRLAPLAWNTFGALDLVLALALGVMTGPGPLQVFATGMSGPFTMLTLPWSLIPTVLVPFYLIVHGIIFAQLRQNRAVGQTAIGFAGP